jgi:MFS superfamily sulfate permease-like transporter
MAMHLLSGVGIAFALSIAVLIVHQMRTEGRKGRYWTGVATHRKPPPDKAEQQRGS